MRAFIEAPKRPHTVAGIWEESCWRFAGPDDRIWRLQIECSLLMTRCQRLEKENLRLLGIMAP
jgi:hypothetical protein